MLPYGHTRVNHVQILFFRSLTFNKILDILDEEDEPCDIYIEPSDVLELTDEDSADEDERPERLSGNQLLAGAKTRHQRETFDTDERKPIAETESHEPPSKKSKRKHHRQIQWKVGEEKMERSRMFPEPNHTKYRDFTLQKLCIMLCAETDLTQ